MNVRIRHVVVALFLALLAVLAGCASVALPQRSDAGQADRPIWPQWRGPKGDGTSTETRWNPRALAGGAKVLWTADVGIGYSCVVVQDNRLYTMGLGKQGLTVWCLDATTGKTIWERSPCPSLEEPQSTPAVDEKQLYGIGKDGTVFCLRTADGDLVWKKSLREDLNAPVSGYGWSSSPVVDGDVVLLNANNAGTALDRNTGDTVWTSESFRVGPGTCYSTPVVAQVRGTRCAVLYGPLELSAVDIATGKKLWAWRHGSTSELIGDPVVF